MYVRTYVVCMYVCMCVCVCVYVCLFVCTYACMNVYTIYLSIYPSIHPSVCPSLYLPTYLPIYHLPIYFCIYLSVYQCTTERQLLHIGVTTARQNNRYRCAIYKAFLPAMVNAVTEIQAFIPRSCTVVLWDKQLYYTLTTEVLQKRRYLSARSNGVTFYNAIWTDASPRWIPLPNYGARNSTKCHFVIRRILSTAFRSEICCAPESNFKS